MEISPVGNTSSVCSTQECIETAKSILDDIDFNIDPCSDFYQFTCGNWLKNAIIPEDRTSNGTFEEINDININVMHDILEGTYEDAYQSLFSANADDGFHIQDQADADKENFETMKSYYNTCMNLSLINTLGPTPIYQEIAIIQTHLLPVSDNESQSFSEEYTEAISQTLSLFSQYGMSTLFSVFVDADDRNPDMNVILFDQAALGLPSKEYYNDPSVLEKYRTGLNDILYKVLGNYSNGTEDAVFRDRESKRYGFQFWSQEEIADAVEDFIGFETQLANISLKNEDLQDPIKLYNPIKLSEFQSNYPLIDWTSIISSLLPSSDLAAQDTIIDRTPQYYESLHQWLSSGTIKVKALQRYFAIVYVINRIYALDETSRAAYRKMNGEISSGTSVAQPRWRTCVSYTSSTFSNVIGRYYTLKRFGGEAERLMAETLLTSIHEAWLNRLPNITWLDEQTRMRAIEKLNLITHKVGYNVKSPDLRQPNSIQTYNKGISVNKTSFYDTENSIALWYSKKMWKKAGQEIDKDEWFMSPQTVNAYYSPNTNQIVFPAGILQPTFYNSIYPDYLNYGGIGMVIGHELTHAFDSSGRKFDGNGNLINWWTNTTSIQFDEKAQCFIDQYSKFNITGPDNKTVNVNGKLTLGENLADNGGISASLSAYQKLAANRTTEPRLPGLESLSSEALFFVNFGRAWCKKQRPQIAYQLIFTDEHSPAVARINGVVQNSAEFARVFNCPVGSAMNPADKCEMW
ncbi:MAG: hypothetical protein EXX96DRAFT_638830 [Benjaminiella poitrasii]|nr:MAG: hypothetical protein EXX96DRAFT_638830 [Benjaminiella poitrasii]